MRHIAKALATMGRGPDTELLHVSKRELAHLAGIAGLKELPKNPKTGLPEAGLFENILPIVGGVGGFMLGGPGGAALGAGLGSKLGGKSDEEALRNAAIGGIGGMGYAAFAPEAAAAAQGEMLAAQTAGLEGAQGSMLAAQEAAPMAATAGAAPGVMPAYLNPAEAAPGAFSSAPSTGGPSVMGDVGAGVARDVPIAGMNTTGPGAYGYTPTAQSSIPNAVETPGFGSKALGWAGDHPMQAAMLGGMAANALTPAQQAQKRRVELKGMSRSGIRSTGVRSYAGNAGGPEKTYFSGNNSRNYTQDPSTYEMRYAEGGSVQSNVDPARRWLDPDLATQQAGERTQAQQAWQVQNDANTARYNQPAAPDTGPYQEDWYSKLAAQHAPPKTTPEDEPSKGYLNGAGFNARTGLGVLTMGGSEVARAIMPNATQGISDQISSWFADGGPVHYAQGGALNTRPHGKQMGPMFLKGAGDGMSDSIHAQIDGQGNRPHEPIRVADGEYIIPADAVSHLGNGSSNAGSKKLDQMVSGIRRVRTGKKKQAPQINPDKYMPK